MLLEQPRSAASATGRRDPKRRIDNAWMARKYLFLVLARQCKLWPYQIGSRGGRNIG
jgi:hypothetical protein